MFAAFMPNAQAFLKFLPKGFISANKNINDTVGTQYSKFDKD
jgi:hypothetical protein